MADLTGKTIAELTEDTAISGQEIYPIMDGATSKKLFVSGNFLLRAGVPLASGDDLNDPAFLEAGTYYSNAVSGILNKPADLDDSAVWKMVCLRSSSYNSIPRVWQIIYVMGYSCTEYRRYYGSNGWGSWIAFNPSTTGSRLDALEGGALGSILSASKFTVASGETSDDIPLTRRAVLIVIGAASAANGVYLLYNYSSSSNVTVQAVKEASAITVTGATAKFTVANASSYGAYCLLLSY